MPSSFESYGIRGGVWSGRLTAPVRPGRVCVTLLGEVVATAGLSQQAEDAWEVRAELPGGVISDGVTSLILIADDAAADAPVGPDSQWLGRLNLAAGKALDEDLVAEIATIRSELELLKREFRRFAAGD